MSQLRLPPTRGCLVCGRENPVGLKLDLYVETETGAVTTTFTPTPHHAGFEGIVHGGLLATVLDEAMVWSANWAGKRACLCAEMSIRYRVPVRVGAPVCVVGRVTNFRSRLIATEGSVIAEDGTVLVSATGKYIPMPAEQNRDVVKAFLITPETSTAADALVRGAP